MFPPWAPFFSVAEIRRLVDLPPGYARLRSPDSWARTGGFDGETPLQMAGRRSKRRSSRLFRGRILLRWLGVGVVLFIAFLYSQPLRSYLSTRDALSSRAQEVRSLRAEKRRLERRLTEADTPEALTREARRLGYVKPGEQLFIVKGIAAWRRVHQHLSR
jgi:cell division protein FtsB